jgi:hypothetical protein
MKTLRLLATGAVMAVWALAHNAHAQCTETLSFSADLNAQEAYTDSIFLVGDLTTLTVNLDIVTAGGSYPSDLLVYVFAPNGECVVWGGWNLAPDPGCTNYGTGTGGAWPTNWNTTTDGFFTATFDFSALGLGGAGAWVVTVVNGYTSSSGSDGDYEFVFSGPCAGDCNIEGACNYNPDGLNPNEDVCWWPEDVYGIGYDCDGNCLNDFDGDAICDETDPCIGEYDACQVCNGPGAIYECGCYDIPETDCDCNGNQLDALGVCGGTCAADEDGDGICDACIPPDGYWLEVETVMEHTEDTLAGMTTYRVHLVCQNISDYMYSMSGSALSPLILNSTSGSWYNHPANASWNPSGLDVALLDEEPLLAYDSFLTIGSENSAGGPFPGAVWSAGDPRPEFQPGEGNNITVNSGNGLNYLIFPGMGQVNTHPGFAGSDFRILIMQMTTAGDIYGQMNVQVYPGGQSSNAITTLLEFDSSSLCYDLDPCVGEYDECGVCAGPGAIYECGCSGPEEGFCDCDGNMLDAVGVCGGDCAEDLDADGVCDVDEVLGCDDDMACNYSLDATENDGSCTYAEDYYDCDGMCLMDMDGDGVCDELEVAGCMDEMACNYDPTATDDNQSCTYPEEFLDCNGECMNDVNGNDVCDELETAGCLDDLACNYVADATLDDGSCEYAEEYYDCDGNCLNDEDGDGVCDELEITGCMQLEACNWNPDATDGDDSCEFPGDACDDGDDTTVNDVLTADCDCLGEVDRVDEFAAWGIELFPTPVSDVMNLRFRGEAGGTTALVLTNAAGQVVRSVQLSGDGSVDVTGLADGVYFVTLKGAWGTATRRVMLAGGR